MHGIVEARVIGLSKTESSAFSLANCMGKVMGSTVLENCIMKSIALVITVDATE